MPPRSAVSHQCIASCALSQGLHREGQSLLGSRVGNLEVTSFRHRFNFHRGGVQSEACRLNGEMKGHAITTNMSPRIAALGQGRLGYLVAVLVAMTGIGVTGFLVLPAVFQAGEGMQRMVAPGQMVVLLDDPGAYTIYYEHRAVLDGRVFETSGADILPLSVAVEDGDTGEPVTITPPRLNVEYELGGYAGRAIFSFTSAQPGGYTLSATYPPGVDGPEVVLAVGQGVGRRVATSVLIAIGLPFVAITLASAIAVVTYLRHRRTART